MGIDGGEGQDTCSLYPLSPSLFGHRCLAIVDLILHSSIPYYLRMATRTTATTITTSNSQSHSQSHSRRLAPESPKRDDLASHTRRGLAQLTSAAASTSRNSLRDKSTTYQPRLESSALFGVNSSSNQDQRHGQKRDDNLALCEMDEEELEKRRGPRYFYAPEDDKEWDRVEPNSCIRLR